MGTILSQIAAMDTILSQISAWRGLSVEASQPPHGHIGDTDIVNTHCLVNFQFKLNVTA